MWSDIGSSSDGWGFVASAVPTVYANFLAALDHDPCDKTGGSSSAYQVGPALARPFSLMLGGSHGVVPAADGSVEVIFRGLFRIGGQGDTEDDG